MPTYTVSVHVAAEPGAVFPYVADLPGHSGWSADPVEITPAGDGPVRVGSRYRSTARSIGKTITADLEVTDHAPPSRFGFTVADLTGRWQHEFTLAAQDGGTTVTRRISGRLTPAQAVLFYLVLPVVKRPSARRTLEQLKRQAEAG
jgi:hypothetical protein